MNEAAADILARMREQKAKSGMPAKAQPTIDPEDFHTRLIQVPHRSRQLAFYALVLFCLFWMIVCKNMRLELSWMVIIAPVVMLGGVAALIPAVETWEYRPWQTRARQYERHQIDRWLPR